MKGNRLLKELLGLRGAGKNLGEIAPLKRFEVGEKLETKGREIGTIHTWVNTAGWGFAKPHGRTFGVFVTASEIIEGAPRVGAEIEFEVHLETQRPYATKVRVLT